MKERTNKQTNKQINKRMNEQMCISYMYIPHIHLYHIMSHGGLQFY